MLQEIPAFASLTTEWMTKKRARLGGLAPVKQQTI
jgi:hypothetical protein